MKEKFKKEYLKAKAPWLDFFTIPLSQINHKSIKM